ncbi:Plasmodium exported protein, unknown function [Plasmodium vinckei vinckei]|uniref:Fam-b protein n=1 Tax=Plasmodium vinckei vinckei TaxID=54757 RepID=A0A081I972_PLAVN|nr:Plasmodium exported protein, unknown function [Plasmodium vinckei vinckei]KEG00230.1 hypothetical protein YYE_04919 [Plasmodium vinckei vinckei]VEV58764.1 Plasmodium exported protein, unknown function [Plasmodium vinckei vinckei]
MNSVFSIKSFIFALIVCCQYYQHEANKSDHIFKDHDATITLSSRINRLLAECEAGPSTNPLSSYRRKEKETNAESQKGDLEININENDIVNLENYIEENMNNNNMNDNDDDDETEVEEEGYSSNYRTYSKRDCLTGGREKNPKYFLGINKKKIKKYVTNMNMQAGFVGPTVFGVGYPINQVVNNDMYAPAYLTDWWLSSSTFVYIFHLIRNALFKTRKVNI